MTASPTLAAPAPAGAMPAPPAALLRGFAIDFLTCQRWAALPHLMAPDYALRVGGHLIEGRDSQYRGAMVSQFEQFPGLCVTVHDVVLGADAIAMRFTEHGSSRRAGGRCAAWQGVSLFRVRAGALSAGWAEEDYLARKRQLRTGECDAIEAPHPAPWDSQVEMPDAAAEAVARRWILDAPLAACARAAQDPRSDPDPATLMAVDTVDIDELWSAGSRVAFHATLHGGYAGGFPDLERSLVGRRAALPAAGLLTVHDGAVRGARLVVDRLGLHRALKPR